MSNSSDLFLVVIAGGSGTRFWPKSTSKRPKQLLSFGASPSTLLGQTVARFSGWVPSGQKWIVTTQSLKHAIESEEGDIQVLAEPQARNTAPCIYWAAREVAKKNPKGIMLVMPADHHMAHLEAFQKTAKEAAEWARKNDDLVTLGIHPTRPETGYGYLKTAQLAENQLAVSDMRNVETFVEKPNLEKAKQFLSSGNYLWNGGMFVWRADVILAAFDQWMPELRAAWDRSGGKVEDAYPQMTATSIDYGVMEKAKNVVTFPLDCGWDDLGSWTSLETLADVLKAQQGANVVTDGTVVPVDSTGNIVDVPKRLVALLGVDDLIIVEHGDSLLIANKSRAQDIRKIVDEVKKTRPDLV